MIIQSKNFHDSLKIVFILATGRQFFCAKRIQFFFNIYGMKLNEVPFSSGTVIIHFLDKPYQEINFKSPLNSVRLCK